MVMVIHDLNHAIQYADYVAVIKAGRMVVSGEPKEIVTSKLLADVFRVQADEFACSNGLPASFLLQSVAKPLSASWRLLTQRPMLSQA